MNPLAACAQAHCSASSPLATAPFGPAEVALADEADWSAATTAGDPPGAEVAPAVVGSRWDRNFGEPVKVGSQVALLIASLLDISVPFFKGIKGTSRVASWVLSVQAQLRAQSASSSAAATSPRPERQSRGS